MADSADGADVTLRVVLADDLTGIGTIEGQPRLEGRNAHVIISPVKATAPPKEKKEKPKEQQQPAPAAVSPAVGS